MTLTIAPTPTIIHRHARTTGKTRGTVEIDGRTIGYACRHDRGNRAPGKAWTATPAACVGRYGSRLSGGLGTRYPSRTAAVAALRAFDRFATPERLAAAQDELRAEFPRSYGHYVRDDAWLVSAAANRLARTFVRNHYDRGF